MKKFNAAMSLLILIFCSFHCDSITDTEYDNQFNICGVLRADAYSILMVQEVRVDQTYKMDERSEPWVDDAFVLLSYRTQLDTLYYYDGGLYHDYCDFEPLDTVSIMAIKDGLDTLFGSTIIPGPISIIHPNPHNTVSFSDSIILKICDNGAMYYGYGEKIE